MEFALIIPAFIAGVLTILAPCTLPLVPGYLAFIAGSSAGRLKVFLNGLFFVLGFSVVFVVLGSLVGLGGSFLSQYREVLSQIGGIVVIVFGLYLMGVLKLPFLNVEKHIKLPKVIKPGNPASSLVFGSAFGLGWTPCIGPVLGAVLTLAAFSGTVLQGAFLLAVFSIGLAVPFLLMALAIGSAQKFVAKISKYLGVVSFIGGAFIVFLGILLLTNTMNLWIIYAYRVLDFINYEGILELL